MRWLLDLALSMYELEEGVSLSTSKITFPQQRISIYVKKNIKTSFHQKLNAMFMSRFQYCTASHFLNHTSLSPRGYELPE